MNESFFAGHFPDEPIMPGVLLVEAMSQCGALFVLNNLDEPEKYSTYFVKIDKIQFHKKVVPGDTLICKVEQTAPLRHGISIMRGYVFVGEKLVAEAQFTGQIIKNKD
jgi:UDP-3-O-[3-hydroxymyristoyl] N-acetylglucosamine deacetylase/3-hydroxyacyl-[acyl-carrier-protein] dehydratase